MLVVTEEMVVVDCRKLAPLCQQTKVTLNGKSYKRLKFGRVNGEPIIQWMCNGIYMDPDKERILEKIFQDIIDGMRDLSMLVDYQRTQHLKDI